MSPGCRKTVDFWESKEEVRKSSVIGQDSQESVNMPEKAEIKVAGGGLAERLAALKQAGEEGWKKRVKKDTDTPELIIKKLPKPEETAGDENEDPVQLRTPKAAARPVSLVDRLSKLNAAQNEWQKKVGEKDTEKFTVAGKMERDKFVKANTPTVPTPTASSSTPRTVVEKFVENTGKRMTPKMTIFRGSGVKSEQEVSTPVTTRETVSKRPREPSESVTPSASQQDVDKFFSPQQSVESNNSEPGIDFDDIAVGEPLLNTRRNINRPKRNKVSKNPVKNLAARTDLMEDFTDDLFIGHEKEPVKETVETSSVHSHLAAEALAGLASTEDFTSVKLTKGVKVPNQNMLPHKEKMLIQVKGRRFCQSRIVEPVPSSLNSGDCYILVTPTEIFNWQGKFSNVIERSRSAEMSLSILQKKDLGCKRGQKVETIEEEKLSTCGRENRHFWKCLTGSDETGMVKDAGPPEEDEVGIFVFLKQN